MVIALRTIFYGIPILVVGVLAALPFRRVREPSEVVEQPAPVDDWSIAPIQELSAAELAAWERERENRPADPMQSLAESMPPIADSYQAVAVPLSMPAKIADRFSAVAREDGVGSNQPDSDGPLVGRPAAFVSTGVRRSPSVAEPTTGWNTGIPIGQPSRDHQPLDHAGGIEQLAGQRDRANRGIPLKAAPAEASSILPPPRPKQARSQNGSKHENAQPSDEPWPTLAELADAKRANETNQNASRTENIEEQVNSPERVTDEDRSTSGGVSTASRSSEPEGHFSSIRETSDDAKRDRQRFFIREPNAGDAFPL